jgi:hypothetical protein
VITVLQPEADGSAEDGAGCAPVDASDGQRPSMVITGASGATCDSGALAVLSLDCAGSGEVCWPKALGPETSEKNTISTNGKYRMFHPPGKNCKNRSTAELRCHWADGGSPVRRTSAKIAKWNFWPFGTHERNIIQKSAEFGNCPSRGCDLIPRIRYMPVRSHVTRVKKREKPLASPR